MKITAEQLNQAATLLGLTDKNAVISVVLVQLVKAGVAVEVAYDAVFGEGAYLKLTGEIYNTLRAA